MHRNLRNDLEAEAITLEADAAHIEQAFRRSEMREVDLESAIRLYVEPRRELARDMRALVSKASGILPVGDAVVAG